MKRHPLYQQLRQLAINSNYTVERIRNLTFEDAAELFGTNDFTTNFFENIKKNVIMILQDRDDEKVLQELKAMILTWLEMNLPNYYLERTRENGSRLIKIWLDGEPYDSEE